MTRGMRMQVMQDHDSVKANETWSQHLAVGWRKLSSEVDASSCDLDIITKSDQHAEDISLPAWTAYCDEREGRRRAPHVS
jgi:hypothetical protein